MVADPSRNPGLQCHISLPSIQLGRPAKNGCSSTNHLMQTKLLSAWHQLAASKTCFHRLKHDLIKGMAEANDIFNSMSVPLVRLVGLKMQELSAEGRRASVSLSPPLRSEILQACSPPELCSDNRNRRCPEIWPSAVSRAVSQWPPDLKEENVTAKAAHHVAEFSLLQKQQLRQLVSVVRMVERLVRSQEEAITDIFQDCESHLETLQQSSLVNFKNLHQQVVDMRQQDNHVAYRLRVAEQSYQALMSLAVKIQESGIDKMKKNLLSVKAEVEGMVNELASNMCKPLVAFLKEFKGENGASMAVSKLQRLVMEMDSKSFSEFQTLAAANEEFKTQVKNIDIQLQVRNKEVEKMSLDGEAMHKSLQEKVEELEALRMALAVEAAEKQNYKARLDGETARSCKLEEELQQKEAKLADAVELLQAMKLQLEQEHLQIADACAKSRELYIQISGLENRLSQTKMAVSNYIIGDADATKHLGQLTQLQQPAAEQQQVCSKAFQLERGKQDCWHLWNEFSHLFSNGMADMQSSWSNNAWMKEAVILFTKHCDNQENSEATNRENLLNPDIILEQIMKNAVNWLLKVRDTQVSQQNSSQQNQDNFFTNLIYLNNDICNQEEANKLTDLTAAETRAFSVGFWLPWFYLLAHPKTCKALAPPNHGTASISVCSDIYSQKLKDMVAELQVGVPGLEKPFGSTSQQLTTLAMATVFKPECAGGRVESCCAGSEVLPQQQQGQRRRDVIQQDDHNLKILKYDTLSESPSHVEGLCGSKRTISSSVDQENGICLAQFSAKKVHTCKDTADSNLQSQVQNCPPLHPVIKPQMLKEENGVKDQSTLVSKEGQNEREGLSILLPIDEDSQSTLRAVESRDGLIHPSSLFALDSKNGVSDHSTLPTQEGKKGLTNYSSTLLTVEDKKEKPDQSAKELWQVLELGPDISCNDTTETYNNNETSALESSLTTTRGNQQYCSEPLLVLRHDVQQPARSFNKRASPRLLARRLAHSPS